MTGLLLQDEKETKEDILMNNTGRKSISMHFYELTDEKYMEIRRELDNRRGAE